MAVNGILKKCKKGRYFCKRSDCPTCLNCEAGRKPNDSLFSFIGAQARRALEKNGVTTVGQLSTYSEKQIPEYHGMGKSSIPRLQKPLADKNLSFRI